MLPLLCECDPHDVDFDIWCDRPYETTMPKFARRKRCSACKVLITAGEVSYRFHKYKNESGEHGIELAAGYMCETCGDINHTLSASELEGGYGYCWVNPNENQRELAAQHASSA